MPRIAIIGGHGKVALHLARILAAQGHEVSSLIRKPEDRADVEATGASAVLADVEHLTTEELSEALRGHDAVVWSAGAGGGNPARTYAVDRDAAIRSMDAAAQAGVGRYVMVSYFTSGTDHVPEDNPFRPYAEAKAAADEYLRGTSLDWTILGPGRLTLEPGTGRIEVGEAAEKGDVSREDVARVAAAVLERPETAGRFIAFNNGSTPIEDALTPA
ncbi:SDR family oxidoreductase [Arthrobacter crystallopoietes]|uniref:SDR family oxidoreductase n=1 Tax=Crystallibacter crystallopoietes TaxID=37928 RepID=UPI003D194BE2